MEITISRERELLFNDCDKNEIEMAIKKCGFASEEFDLFEVNNTTTGISGNMSSLFELLFQLTASENLGYIKLF